MEQYLNKEDLFLSWPFDGKQTCNTQNVVPKGVRARTSQGLPSPLLSLHTTIKLNRSDLCPIGATADARG